MVTLESNTLCPSFLLTFKIFNYNAHNCSIDFRAFVTIMPLSIAKKINDKWEKTNAQIIQLKKSLVQAIFELKNVLIILQKDDEIHQYIILIVDILKAYGLLLSRYWSNKLQRYFAIDWSHLWFPYKGKNIQIWVETKPLWNTPWGHLRAIMSRFLLPILFLGTIS